jgi:hypothetical protein
MTGTEEGVTEPMQDRIDNDYNEGSTPRTRWRDRQEGALVPPYEDRSKGDSASEAQTVPANSVRRQLSDADAPKEANPESLVGPTGGSPGNEPPNTPESVGRIKQNAIRKLAGTKTRTEPTRLADPLSGIT